MHRAMEAGLTVLKPYGDHAPYDVVIDNGRAMLKIQVKSVRKKLRSGLYQVQTKHGATQRPYRRGEVDFVAAYIIADRLWFIVPIQEFAGRTAFYIRINESRYEQYRENWSALR